MRAVDPRATQIAAHAPRLNSRRIRAWCEMLRRVEHDRGNFRAAVSRAHLLPKFILPSSHVSHMPSSLESFGLPEMLRCGRGIRSSSAGAQSMEEALNRICRYLFDELQTASNERACVLVRCYKTHRFGKLQSSQKAFARKLIDGAEPGANMRCLTLLASVGEDPRWNDIKRSRGHRAIPLPRKEIVEKAPMIAQLIKQFGLDWNDVIDPQPELLRDREGKSYGVFHVEDAAGSPYIPAQDEFVLRYKIRS